MKTVAVKRTLENCRKNCLIGGGEHRPIRMGGGGGGRSRRFSVFPVERGRDMAAGKEKDLTCFHLPRMKKREDSLSHKILAARNTGTDWP